MAGQTMALSWVHCNVCCSVPSPTEDKVFSLFGCGHLSCSECVNKNGTENCCVCGKKCSKVLLKQPLPAQVVPWVTDPLPSLRQLKEAFRFQTMQYNHFMELQMKKYIADYNALLKKKELLESKKNQLMKEIGKRKAYDNFPRPKWSPPRRTPNLIESRQITLQTPATLGLNNSHQK